MKKVKKGGTYIILLKSFSPDFPVYFYLPTVENKSLDKLIL